MKLKQGVTLDSRVKAPILYALGIAEVLFRQFNRELVVTSLTEGEHKTDSLHYKGLAADIRIRHLSAQEQRDVFVRFKNILDYMGFDVVLEADHIHIEFDFKKGDEDWIATSK
jgi:hypothetical protein